MKYGWNAIAKQVNKDAFWGAVSGAAFAGIASVASNALSKAGPKTAKSIKEIASYTNKVDDYIDDAANLTDDILNSADDVVKGGADVSKTIPQKLVEEGQVPTIGKMRDLNTPGKVVDGEFKVADYLPDMGNPQSNWHQNSGVLRSIMNEGMPIKDVSPFPMNNAGFLGAERNLLISKGWTYINGYWYPPK